METGNAVQTIHTLEVSLILVCVGAAGGCSISVSQPSVLEVDPTQGAATVPCTFSSTGCPPDQPRPLWFRHRAQQPEPLCLDGCTSEEDKFTVREALAQSKVSLTVNRLTTNDSAVYICGIASPSSDPGAKQTGAGTALVVRGARGPSKRLQGLLIAVLSLLSVYVAVVLGVFIVLSKSKSNTLRNKETEESQKKKSARRLFQEIAQELYNKRHVGPSQQPEKDSTYENRSTPYNYETP